MCGFIAQLVEHRTGIAEVTGSNPVEALIFFRLLHSNCLKLKFTAKITYHLHVYPQFIYESFHILHVISLLSRENKNSQLTLLPMCGFIAQLVEHRTGIAEVTGSNPVEALIFFRLLHSNCLKLEIHCEDHISSSESKYIGLFPNTWISLTYRTYRGSVFLLINEEISDKLWESALADPFEVTIYSRQKASLSRYGVREDASYYKAMYIC